MTFEPPGQQPPYGQQPYPAPPAKPRSNVRTILIIIGIVAVLCCGGAIAGGYFLFKSVQDATAPAQAAAVAYVEDLIENDYSGAYGRLCNKEKLRMNEEVFAGLARRTFDVTDYSVTSTNVMNNNGKVSAMVTMNLTLNGGAKRTQVFPMVKEGDAWKVCE